MVVVDHELGEQREQMPLIEHDDVVKTVVRKYCDWPARTQPYRDTPGTKARRPRSTERRAI
jgi:hypothetical protein